MIDTDDVINMRGVSVSCNGPAPRSKSSCMTHTSFHSDRSVTQMAHRRRSATWSSAQSSVRASVRSAFTLVELIVVILIIMVLMGLLLPAIGMVRQSVNKGAAQTTMTGLHMAMTVYFQEDARKRYPAMEADKTLQTKMVVAGPKRALDLLREKGLNWKLDQVDGATGALLDPWSRPFQYQLDDNMDDVIDRPAPRNDWNGKDVEPYAYVWSFGQPKNNTDETPAGAERWIYKAVTK